MSFPPGFLWGTATAAYQVEGGATEGGRGPSIWDTFSHTPGATADGDTGDVACDHHHKLEEDLDHLAALGAPLYRFSISWSRLFPAGEASGPPLAAGVAFYNRLIDGLLQRGVAPVVTLYHWDLPSALGHWASGERARLVAAFAHYARACFAAFGDRVQTWVTINEPWVVAVLGHGTGEHAPGRVDADEPYEVAHVLLLAHAAAVAAYRVDFGPTQGGHVGIALNSDWVYPAGGGADGNDDDDNADGEAAAAVDRAFGLGWFADPIWGDRGDYPPVMRASLGGRLPRFSAGEAAAVRGSSDFFGLNHYSSRRVATAPGRRPCAERLAAAEAEAAAVTAAAAAAAAASPTRTSTVGEDGGAAPTGGAAPAVAPPPLRDGPAAGRPYFSDVGVSSSADPEWPVTAMGWSIVPDGFRRLLGHITTTYAPAGGIWVTENGLAATGETSAAAAAAADGPPAAARAAYLSSYVAAMAAAIADDGADVRAYCLWSLLDNFEWAFGYSRRFGLLWVDFADAARLRTRKPAFEWYRRVVAANGLPLPVAGEGGQHA